MTPRTGLTFQRHTQAFTLLDPKGIQWSHGPQSATHAWARVGVLHQGDIDNHLSLRSQLEERGFPFVTASAGELVAHLIDAVHPGDALQAVRRAAALLQGSFGFAVQFRDQPGRLLATRAGSPWALHFDGSSVRWRPAADPVPARAGDDASATLFHLNAGEILDLQPSPGRAPVRAGAATAGMAPLIARTYPRH